MPVSKPAPIQLWAPSLNESEGGIQRYSAALLRALHELRPEHPLDVILLQDRHTHLPEASYTSFSGHLPPKLRPAHFALRAVLRTLLRRPALILSTHIHFAPLAAQLKRLLGIRFICVAHGIEAWGHETQRLQSALSQASKIMVVSSFTQEKMSAALALPTSLYARAPGAFDPEKFKIGKKPQYLLDRYQLTTSQPVLFTLARLSSSEAYKGYTAVLRALPALRAEMPALKYILAGSGDDLPAIKRLIQEHQLESVVLTPGQIPETELCDHYNLCDVFVMPSSGEGLGIVFLEALACGKPVIAGNADGSRDVLEEGTLGLAVNPLDLGEIQAALLRILAPRYTGSASYQPELLRQAVIERFGFEQFKKRIAAVLEETTG